jgi:hypothetical protein
MLFFPVVVCYMSMQDAYQKSLAMSTSATKMAVAAMTTNPFLAPIKE